MSQFQVDAVVRDLDKAMKNLRESMAGLQVRSAGFKKEHDELAREVANYSVDLLDVSPHMKTT
ncbi:hypothetical protein GCM10027271_18430 [Saccharopolyspora gloriosae]|uniref:WXG100 family type VII secretion target n=1 Tax=Saccharopolyspora gloriosae TaxID=455344 RepID=A0A840NAJ5_9PSEU|nr:hypothetical protein [Saccharopolyspora gloriosae]MBB5067393.1 hypothetical protein [Saccharopolyspora gloriosae]